MSADVTTTTVTELKVIEPKKVDPSKFASGWSIMREEQWLVLIATEHCRIKYPGFYPLCPGLDFDEIDTIDLSTAQLAFCRDYWNNVLSGPSEKALAMRRSLTRGRKIDCPELDSQIFIIEWDAPNNRAKKGTGQWVSYRGTKPRFRFGVMPKSGKIGGHPVEDTHRNKFSQISVRSLAALLVEIMRIEGCDNETAKKIFNSGRQAKRFFVSHGHGLWSGTHPTVSSPTTDQIEAARELLTAEKANRKPKTDIQVKLWTLFATMPPKHVNDIPAWLIEDSERVVILTEFQAASTSENIREMSLEDYAHYRWRNLCNTVRDDNMMPVIQVGRSRWQGKRYIESPEVAAAKAKSAKKDRQDEKNIADILEMVCANPIEPQELEQPQEPEYQGYESERTPDMTDEQSGRWCAACCARVNAEESAAKAA
jgi:hypothetical protein